MIRPDRRLLLVGLAALPLLAALPRGPAAQGKPFVFATRGVAINGHDPVAYLNEGRPVPGTAHLAADWMGATFRFASPANRDRFAADPEGNAPQFGGWCAWAVAEGYLAGTEPEAFTVHEGRLYLNANLKVRTRWERDIPGNIARGRANWPGVLAA